LARKILLADDSVTAQNMGRKILADAGYEVIAVNNGSAALKKILELKPDLVILDVYMPGYSGLEVCQRLKDSPETARIPVLLTVGKLEPFKPEEAQRVRAEAYIVKPFEASELLSALSKLEDKVVPRSESSKPGRFARAIAAAEESGRGGGENGWKSRIAFPREKTETAEKNSDESSTYNPVNRDLRTVVETGGEKAAVQAAKDEAQREQPEAAAEFSVDVAALAPAGLPKDVTPEEVAAIAAAAAQIQMAGALQDEHRNSDFPIAETKIETQPDQMEASDRIDEGSASPDVSAQSVMDGLDHEPAAAGANEKTDSGERPQIQDEPVTMAATAESVVVASPGESRWTAVPVALESDEATLSLDQEMQKADADTAAPQPEPVPEPEPAINAEATQAELPPVAQLEAPTSSCEAAVPTPDAAEAAPVEASAGIPPMPEFAGPKPDPARVTEFMSPVSEAEVANLAGLGLSAEVQQPTPLAELAIAEAEAKPESETVKSTAAAWASWRDTRDTGKDREAMQARTAEFEALESAPAETALAVAAGAEQAVQEASSAPSNSDSSDVASIVDSVLADLRPKLMAEISRKMAEKK